MCHTFHLGSFLMRAPLLKGLAEKNAASESDSPGHTFMPFFSFPAQQLEGAEMSKSR